MVRRRPLRRPACNPARRAPLRRRTLAAVLVAASAAGLSACSHEAVTPDSARVLYATLGSTDANPSDRVAVVDSRSGQKARPFTVGTLPSGLVLEHGSAHLLVAVKAENALVEVDTATGKVTRRVTVGLEPDAVALTPDGNTALVADFGDATLTVVRLADFGVASRVPVGRQPVAVAVTPDGRLALVACYQDGTLNPVALTSLVPGPPVPVGPEPLAVHVTGDGRTALVAGFQTSTVVPVSLPGLTAGGPVPVGVNPTGIDGLPGAPTVWVSGGSSIVPLTVATGQVGAPFAVGGPAQCIAVTYGAAWVCRGDGTLVQIDTVTGRVIRRVAAGGIPSAIVLSPPFPA